MSSSRKDFNPSVNAKMGNNSSVNKAVANAAREVGVSKEALSKLVHDEKGFEFTGDYSYSQLKALAQEIKDKGK